MLTSQNVPRTQSFLTPAKSLLPLDSITILAPRRPEGRLCLTTPPLTRNLKRSFELHSVSPCSSPPPPLLSQNSPYMLHNKAQGSYAITSGKMDPTRSLRPPTQRARHVLHACSCHPGFSASPSVHLSLPQDLDTSCFLHVNYFCVSYLEASCLASFTAQMERVSIYGLAALSSQGSGHTPLTCISLSPPWQGFLCEPARGLKRKLTEKLPSLHCSTPSTRSSCLA